MTRRVASFAVLVVILLAMPLAGPAQTLSGKFDTKGHPKAKGIWMTVRYPARFKAEEGERPNTVQTFRGHYDGVFAQLVLQIRHGGPGLEAECRKTPALEFVAWHQEEMPDAQFTRVSKTTHEGKPAFMFDMSHAAERAGISMRGHYRTMNLCHGENLVATWCGVAAPGTAAQLHASLETIAPLCHQFFNSVVLMDRY